MNAHSASIIVESIVTGKEDCRLRIADCGLRITDHVAQSQVEVTFNFLATINISPLRGAG